MLFEFEDISLKTIEENNDNNTLFEVRNLIKNQCGNLNQKCKK